MRARRSRQRPQTTETATRPVGQWGVVLKIGTSSRCCARTTFRPRDRRHPGNLRAKPTLSVTVESARAAPRRDAQLPVERAVVEGDMITVALFDEGPGKLDLQGWVTLTNTSAVRDYPDAAVQLVAGDVNLVRSEAEDWQRRRIERNGGVRRAGGRHSTPGRGRVADYYLYPLPGRTTVAQNQTKQVSFLDASPPKPGRPTNTAPTVRHPADAGQRRRGGSSPTRRGRASASLPAGDRAGLRPRRRPGEPKFVGENRIDHTPQGSDISVKIGEAFDVTVQPTVLTTEQRQGRTPPAIGCPTCCATRGQVETSPCARAALARRQGDRREPDEPPAGRLQPGLGLCPCRPTARPP